MDAVCQDKIFRLAIILTDRHLRHSSSPSAAPRYIPTVIEANSISQPTDAKASLTPSEGTYILRDTIHLGAIPPHPADPPPQALNVLDTRVPLPTAGSCVTLIRTAPARSAAKQHLQPTSESSTDSSILHSQADASHNVLVERGQVQSSNNTTEKTYLWPVFGEGNPALAQPLVKEGKDAAKRRKPRNSVNKSSSSFISRFLPHENLSKRLQEHAQDGLFAFVNINRAMLWLDLNSTKKADQLSKILFTKAHALCHDANLITRNFQHLDLVLGFSTNDILWYEAFSQRYSRINKNGIINPSPVAGIRWLPGSENLFVAAHFDGSLVFYDKEKEDGQFILEEDEVNAQSSPSVKHNEQAPRPPRIRIRKSVQSRNQKTNPVAFWKVSNERVQSIEFSPDGQLLAVVCEDGALRIIDYAQEQLLDLFSSYYGGFTSVAWSPDGRYLVTGGQDDIVSIWSLEERVIVARGVGHNSWISALAFDPWRCDEGTYRFGSVGEDCRLLLWDFSVGMLHRPRAASVRQSISSHAANEEPDSSLNQATSTQEGVPDVPSATERVRHVVEPRLGTAFLPPVLSKEVDEHPLCWITFQETLIMASCRSGHILTWDRPAPAHNDHTASAKDHSSSVPFER